MTIKVLFSYLTAEMVPMHIVHFPTHNITRHDHSLQVWSINGFPNSPFAPLAGDLASRSHAKNIERPYPIDPFTIFEALKSVARRS